MLQADRLRQPAVEAAPLPQLKEPSIIYLSNGIPVYIFEDQSQQAMRFDLITHAGSALQHKILAAGSTIGMLREGTNRHSGSYINARIEYHGAYLDLQSTKDIAWLNIYCLDSSLPKLLPLAAEILFEPSFDPKAFKRYNQRQKQQFILSGRKSKQLAQRMFNKLVYGPDALYGQTATEADFDLIKVEDLHYFHQQHIASKAFSIILSGPVKPSLLHQIEQLFGQHAVAKVDNQQGPYCTAQTTGMHHFPKEDALQSAIMMGRQIMLRSDPDYFGFLVLNTLLGGYFGSRLMSNIREDKGYTYGIHSQVIPYKHATTFVIRTEVGTDVTRQSLDEIQKELQSLMDVPVAAEELQLVKNYLNGSYLRALDGSYNQADKFRSTLDMGGKMQYFSDSLRAINQTDAQTLQRLAQTWLQPEKMLTVVVGKKGME